MHKKLCSSYWLLLSCFFLRPIHFWSLFVRLQNVFNENIKAQKISSLLVVVVVAQGITEAPKKNGEKNQQKYLQENEGPRKFD